MRKLSSSIILNIGSATTFVAFPILHAAAYNGNAALLFFGMGLIFFSMATPFIATYVAKQ